MQKIIVCFVLLLCCCIPSYATTSKDLLNEIKLTINFIENEQCPKKGNIEDKTWVKQKITCMVAMDQAIAMPLYGSNSANLNAYLNNVLTANTIELKKILSHYGWLTISTFGKKTDQQTWLLVQHADHDLTFQASILFVLEKLAIINETDPKNFAYLYDRVALKYQSLGLKQRYGTQFKFKDGNINLLPYEGTLEDVENQRKKIGLESLRHYLNKAKAMFLTNPLLT